MNMLLLLRTVMCALVAVGLITTTNCAPTPCKDTSTLCGLLSQYCEDETHGDWMRTHCADTCHHCKGATTQPPPAPETTIAPPPAPETTMAPPPAPETTMVAPPAPETTGGKKSGGGKCGIPAIKGTRIVGGKDAVAGSWPWQILLLFAGYPSCGGSIVSPEWVVTAAHCVFMMENYTNEFTVRTGEYDRTKLEGTEREYDVSKIIIHTKYDPYALNNDIAMIKLKTPIIFDKYRIPVCLPTTPPAVGDTCYITGWGKMKHTGSMVNVLQQGKLPVVSQETCGDLNLKNIGIPVTEAMICGGSGGKSILSGCHGDSGGPYVCESGGRWMLQGAVSHGSPKCNSTETYTVFARITYFKSWIENNMKLL